MAPDLVAEFVRAFNDELNQRRRDQDHRRADLHREQKDLEHRIDTLLEAFASGILKGTGVQAKLEALEARKAQVAAGLADIPDAPIRLHPQLAAVYRGKVAELHTLLDDDGPAPKRSSSSVH